MTAVVVALGPCAAFADALVVSVRGDVRADGRPIRAQQRISKRTTIDTGRKAQVLLRFDDGHRVLLEQNSVFRIVDFQYRAASPDLDRSIFELLRGAGRFVSGAIGRRNPGAYELRTPQAILWLRGTDFMLVIGNPLYIHVLEGAVAANNAPGTVVFGAGSLGSVADAYTLPVSMPAGGLAPSASSVFSSLQSVAMHDGAVAPIAGTASGAAPTAAGAPGLSTGAMVGIAAAAALIAVAAGGGGGGGASASHH